MLGIRCLSITLSLALVIITGGVIGGLSITTGNRVTDQTKSTGQRGLDATHKVCNDGFDSLRATMDNGLGACFTSGRDNAEYLGGLLLEQVKNVIVTQMGNLLDAPFNAVQQMYDTLATIPPATLNDGKMWDDAHARWIYNIFRASVKRGVAQLQVQYLPKTFVDGVSTKRIYYHIDHPRTLRNTPDEYHQLMLVADMPFKCYPGNTFTRSECAANYCVWCNHNGGGAGYCGHPKRVQFQGEYSADAAWAPCKAGYSPAVPAPKPKFANRDEDVYLGTADETGRLYIGSCGIDGGEEHCGCAAHRDFQEKLMVNNGTVKGWPLGRPPRTGTREPYQELPRIGSYRRPDGTYPAPLTTDKDAVLEAGHCPMVLSLAGLSDIAARQNAQTDRFGDIRWTPIGAGTAVPLLSLMVFKSWTHRSLPMKDGDPAYVGYASAGIDANGFSAFMRRVDLPPESRMYAVQVNPWMAAPNKCEDDFHGMLKMMSMNCATLEMLKPVLGLTCESDLRTLSEYLGAGNYLWWHCPASCGRCPWKLEETVGVLVGATHGELAIEHSLEESSYGQDGLKDLGPLHVFNSTDDAIRNHAKWVMTKPEHYETFPTAEVVPWTDEDGRLWWTKVATITMPSGPELLKIYLVILVQRDQAMKAIDAATRVVQNAISNETAAVLSEVEQQRSRTAAVIEKENQDTEDEKEKDFMIMYIIVAVCVVVLMVVSVVFVNFTIAPLLVLEREMAEVAVMKLENIDRERPLSALGEVAQMQRSFLQMVCNLIEYRNYMPQSILCDDEEDEEVEPEDGTEPANRQGIGSRENTDSKSRASDASDKRKSEVAHRQSSAASTRAVSRIEVVQKKFANASDELRKRAVSFCAFNLAGWNELQSSKGDSLSVLHSDYLGKVIAKVTSSKGIPDTFCGDRILGTFNGVKPCATHRAQSAQCAQALITQMEECAPETRVTGSVVSGECKFGNMGCTGAKRFTFVGGTYTWAWALERYSLAVGTSLLCDKWIHSEAANSLFTRVVGVLSFPKRSPTDLVVHQMLGNKSVGEDEWMYQLEQAAANDPYAAWNRVALHVVAGSFEDARAAMEEVKGQSPPGVALPDIVREAFEDAIQLQKYIPTRLVFH